MIYTIYIYWLYEFNLVKVGQHPRFAVCGRCQLRLDPGGQLELSKLLSDRVLKETVPEIDCFHPVCAAIYTECKLQQERVGVITVSFADKRIAKVSK